MKLFYTPISPFARKCRIVAIEKGIADRLQLVEAPPLDNPPELIAVNPLATVPALVKDDGISLCESPIICEYLDSLTPEPQLIPKDPRVRFDVLALAALADGMMDAAVACVMESRRPQEKQSPEWMSRKENAIMRTIDAIAARQFDIGAPLHIGLINTAVALGYVNFRLPHVSWRGQHPELSRWLDQFGKRPSMVATAPAA